MRWVSCCVLLLSSASLGAQTYFASFTGTTISSDGDPVAGCRGGRHQRRDPGDLHGPEQQRGPLHHLVPAHRHLQDPRAGAGLPGLRDQRDPARVGPERAGRHQAAGRRLRRDRRGHRGHPHPADPGCGGRRGHLGHDHRAHAAQRAQLLAALAAAARRHHHRARTASPSRRTSAPAGRSSTASASRRTTTRSTAST